MTAGRMRGQTRQVQPLSARTRDGARSEVLVATPELQTFDEALLTEAAGSGVIFGFATEIQHEIQWRACDDFGLAAESTQHPGESDCDFRLAIGVQVTHRGFAVKHG